MKLFGSIEAGGTKFVCAVASDPDHLLAEIRFPTTTPQETIGQAIAYFKELAKKMTEEEKKERLAWWTHDRFGMFIHWGTYALAGRHEWVKKRERLPDEEYQKYFENFNGREGGI